MMPVAFRGLCRAGLAAVADPPLKFSDGHLS